MINSTSRLAYVDLIGAVLQEGCDEVIKPPAYAELSGLGQHGVMRNRIESLPDVNGDHGTRLVRVLVKHVFSKAK